MKNTTKAAPAKKQAPPPPPPPPVLTETAAPDGTPSPGVVGMVENILAMPEGDQREILAALVVSLRVDDEDIEEEDAADIHADAHSLRATEPEVFVLALVAKVVGKSLRVEDMGVHLTDYVAGHPKAEQQRRRDRMRQALVYTNQAVLHLNKTLA